MRRELDIAAFNPFTQNFITIHHIVPRITGKGDGGGVGGVAETAVKY